MNEAIPTMSEHVEKYTFHLTTEMYPPYRVQNLTLMLLVANLANDAKPDK